MVNAFFTAYQNVGHKKVRVGKEMEPGLYHLRYRVWSIHFPYMGERIFYVGAEADAEKEAKRIKKMTKWPYNYKITEVTKVFPFG